MKPANFFRLKRQTPPSKPPVGEVDYKFDPATGTLIQIDSNGTESTLGGGLTEAEILTLVAPAPVETVTGTTYSLTPADSGKMLYFTAGSTITLGVEGSELPAGFNVGVIQGGAGAVNFNPADINLNGEAANHETTGQWAVASLLVVASGVAVLKGDVTSLA